MARDGFRPKLGRIRSQNDAGKTASFLKKVARRISKLGAKPRAKTVGSGTRYTLQVSRIARVQATKNLSQRVVVKARFVKMNVANASSHLAYLQRDGVGKDGEDGRLFSADKDVADGRDFVERSLDDQNQFRIIVSPENGADITSLKDFTRDLMEQAQKDLKTKLDWVAIEHHNTDNPHVHIIIKGTTYTGADLTIPREYMSRGFRQRAEERATLELGHRTEHDIAQARFKEVSAERFTSLDREIIAASPDAIIDFSKTRNAFGGHITDVMARVRKLEEIGIVEKIEGGQWRRSETMERDLRALSERKDIIKTINRAVRNRGNDIEVYEPSPTTPPIVGRVAAKGIADENSDRRYIAVDGVDGKMHYVDVGHHPAFHTLKVGSIVEIGGDSHFNGKLEQGIADVAAKHEGIYTVADHDKDLSEKYPNLSAARRTAILETHVRKLAEMAKNGVTIEVAPGAWIVSKDAVQKSADIHRSAEVAKAASRKSVLITVHSIEPISTQVKALGATWIDRQIEQGSSYMPRAASGFGREVSDAIKLRLDDHLQHGLAKSDGLHVHPADGLSKILTERELAAVGNGLAKDNGRAFVGVRTGDKVAGIYAGEYELSSGKFARIDSEDGRSFQLVPWRPQLEKFRGQSVSGIARESGIDWKMGRSQSLPSM